MARSQFSAQVYDKKHQRNIGLIKIKLNAIYDAMCKQAASIGMSTHFSDPDKEFHLSDFPQAEKKMDALLHALSAEVESLITEGNDKAWHISEDKNNAMVESLASYFSMPKERVNEWSRRSVSALKEFQERKVAGMNLSERVWDFVQHDKEKLEFALELGLAEGKSAARLSRDVRSYLNEPERLFRRVRDKDGVLRLSKAAQAYHPGQGVYRSSYKNALRMTITENNMAYRTADHVAWQEMPFVIGQTIKLSNNHTCKGVKGLFFDICDMMQGDYPKDFKFVGWHPHCRCYVIAKMASLDELDKYSQLSEEEKANYHFENEVKDVPQGYKDWMKDNSERIANAKSMPYFIKDNVRYAEEATGLSLHEKGRAKIDSWIDSLSKEEQSNVMQQLHEGISPTVIQNSVVKNISHSVYDYAEKYKDRYPPVKDLLEQVKLEKDNGKKIVLLNKLKDECAVVTKFDLEYVGAIDSSLTYDRVVKNYTLQQKVDYTLNGKTIKIKEKKYDLVVYKDKFGKEYSYPIGIDAYKIPYKASKATKVVADMQGYMRKNFKGILFADSHHPIDAYYQELYKDFMHGAMYSAEPITVHADYNLYDSSFKSDLCHEIGHHIDDKIKMNKTWKQVIDADNNKDGIFKEIAIREYSKNSILEDIADSWSLWAVDRERLKKEFPNRYAAIKKSIKVANQ